jgi:RsiW-degrading membrane proteinase PrsW (M82 family)
MGTLADIAGKMWFRILLAGMVFFCVTWTVMIYTKDILYLPTVIMLGSFLIPVVFVYYVYESYGSKIPIHLLGISFLIGGMLGTLTAGFIEYNVLVSLNFLPLLMVGLIEEGVKLLFPVWVYLRKEYTSAAEGIFFGVASGMGFAALETMGYALVSVIEPGGSITSLLDTLIVRGLLSPTNHAAWTGFFCSVLWSQRKRSPGNPFLNLRIVSAFITIVLLHTFWDIAQSIVVRTYIQFISTEVMSGLIALFSLGLLIYVIRGASREGMKRDS